MTLQSAIEAITDVTGWSQKDLAEVLEVSESHLSRMKKGVRSPSVGKGNWDRLRESLGPDASLADGLKSAVDAINDAEPPAANVRARVDSIADADVMVPWYSISVRAGAGAPIFEEAVRQFNVSKHYRNTAVYEVSGDSMVNAGIEDGDRVVVRLTALFRNNDIILCRYNNTMMVKGATITDGTIWLHPANDHMHSWPVKEGDQFECVGVVEELIRKPYKIKF